MSKKQHWTLILFFLILIFGFTAASLLKPETGFSEKENRMLAKMPEITLERVLDGTFATEYETYLSDQFFWRDQWIGVKTAAERMIGKQEINDIYFARDGYLIEKHSGSFSTDAAKRNAQALAAFLEKWQGVYGADHVKAVIAPNAVEVLKEKLPPFADSAAEGEYLDHLSQLLPADSFVDLRPVFEEHKEEYLYYRTDHHWTTLAARYAYEAWAQEIGLEAVGADEYERVVLSDEFYGTIESRVNCRVTPDVIEAWYPVTEVPYTIMHNRDSATLSNNLYDESYLETKDKYAVFFGGNQPITQISTKAGGERKLLVIKDSYAHCFVPFAVQDFQEIVMIDLRYFNESLTEYMEQNDFTDVLFLYNASGFAQDSAVVRLGI